MDDPTRWLRFDVEVPEGLADAAGARLQQAGAHGVAVADRDTDPGLAGRARVTAWLPARPDVLETTTLSLEQALGDAATIRTAEETDPGWADAWRQWFRPVRAGRRLVVRAPWSEVEGPRDDDVVLVIEPGMAFGTGGHATTRLCLAGVEAAVVAGARSVLDVGTGSGVLAIAAARLGAERVVAVDNDPEAVRAAGENARVNGVGHVVAATSRWPDGRFDLVAANIVTPTLLALRPRLVAAVAAAGTLTLSGILAGEVDGLRAAFEGDGLACTRERALTEDADWVALDLRST